MSELKESAARIYSAALPDILMLSMSTFTSSNSRPFSTSETRMNLSVLEGLTSIFLHYAKHLSLIKFIDYKQGVY